MILNGYVSVNDRQVDWAVLNIKMSLRHDYLGRYNHWNWHSESTCQVLRFRKLRTDVFHHGKFWAKLRAVKPEGFKQTRLTCSCRFNCATFPQKPLVKVMKSLLIAATIHPTSLVWNLNHQDSCNSFIQCMAWQSFSHNTGFKLDLSGWRLVSCESSSDLAAVMANQPSDPGSGKPRSK